MEEKKEGKEVLRYTQGKRGTKIVKNFESPRKHGRKLIFFRKIRKK